MRNKIAALLMIATMTISLSACGSAETGNNDNRVRELEDRISELEAQNAELRQQLGESSQGTTGNNNSSSASASINESTAETWGVCGADLTWYYQNGILVIRGTGDMTDYAYNHSTYKVENPWSELQDKIQWIIIEEGVTSIGSYAFGDCTYLSKIEICSSITSIGDRAFFRCDSLANIAIPDKVEYIGSYLFKGCSNLTITSITISDNIKYIGSEAFVDCDSLNEVIINNPNADTIIYCNAFNNGTLFKISGNEYSWGDFERTENGFYIGGIQIDGLDTSNAVMGGDTAGGSD